MLVFWAFGAAVAVVVVAGATLIVSAAITRRRQDRAAMTVARELFRIRREWLEAEFLTIISENSTLRGLCWSDCDFDNDVAFARDRATGQLCALVAITLSLEFTGSGRMAEVESVSALRAGTAVFYFDGERWSSDGRAIFNLNPKETIRRYRRELEVMD